MKNILKKSTEVLLASFIALFGILFIGSCTVGLGDAIDVDAPTIDISYPPKNAVIRESFIAAGSCDDDLSLDYVEVTVTNTSTKDVYGPYTANLSQDHKSWTVELNKKAEGSFDAFNAYSQWEFPDGNYIISAVAYDKDEKASQEASLPLSIDNTAPVLLVSKPLAVGSENASVYGRNLNIIGDISEEHDTKKLILYYKEFNENTHSFIDSAVRSLEITGFGTMSSDNPLSIAKFDESTSEAASSLLTQNYKSIYGQNVDVSQSNKKNYYCGFLLEDSAKVYKNPGDSGDEEGNKSTQYYILSDDYNESLFSETTYSLNARNLMLLLNGQSSYSQQAISAITNKLKETGNSASSTELNAGNSSKFSIDPKNNPVWAITNFNYSNGTFKGYDLGSAVPLVLKVGGDGIEIDKSTIEVKLYHLGFGETPGVRNSNTPYVTLISRGEYYEGLLKDRVNQEDSALEFTPTDIGLKNNHFYEFVITGSDKSGNSLENEDSLRYGFKLNSLYAAPRISFVSASDSFAENSYKSGTILDSNGIIIKGKITTGHKGLTIDNTTKIKVSGITITDSSDSSINISASDTDSSAQVKYQYEIIDTDFRKTFDGDDSSGKIYEFTAKITKKNDASSLVPSAESSYKYKIAFVAEDSDGSKNEPVEFEFNVDNKAPEIPLEGITVIPTVTKDGLAKVNGTIRVSGSVSEVGSGFSKLYWGIGDAEKEEVTGVSALWTIEINTINYKGQALTDNAIHELKFITEDNVGNKRTQTYDLNVDQETDRPVIEFANDSIIFTKTNNKLIGTITDDDGLSAVTANYKKLSPEPADTTTDFTITALNSGTTSYALSIPLPSDEGEYEITVTAVDVPQLEKGTNNRTITIKKDNGAPDFKITSPNSTAQSYYNESVSITGTVKDGSGEAYIFRDIYKVVNGAERKIGETLSLANTEDLPSVPASVGSLAEILAGKTWEDVINLTGSEASGTYRIRYTAKDKYAYPTDKTGLSSIQTIEFSIDNDKPVIKNVKLEGNEITGWYNTNSGNFSIESSDGTNGSGVVSVAYTKTYSEDNPDSGWVNMSGSGNSWTSFIAFDDAAPVKHIYFRATDKAGNKSEVKAVTLQIDVNAPKLTVSDLSGNKYVNKQNDITINGTFFDGVAESGTASLTFTIGDTVLPESGVTVTQNGNDFTAVIKKQALDTGALTVTDSDIAGNITEVTPCTFIVDEEEPEINEINLSMSNSTPVYKKAAGASLPVDTYYICRTSGDTNSAALTISGTATDHNAYKNIELSVSGHADANYESSASSWNFSGLDFSSWNDDDAATVTLTAYDEAGNFTSQTFDIKFDEAAPELKKDEETITDYTFRGETVKKCNSLRVGGGRYSEQSYGKLTAIDFITYLAESGSGLSKLEYKLYGADKEEAATADLITAFDNTSGWTSSGSFNIEKTNPDNDYDVKATASISGFKPTTGSGTNYLLLRPVDNCGNKGEIEVLSVHVDQTSPTVVASSVEKLTNGTAPIVLSGAVYDVDSGLQALRVKINGETVIETRGNTSVTNDYGTFTYTGYAPENPEAENPDLTGLTTYTLDNAPSYASWTLTLTPSEGDWFSHLPELPVVAIEAEDWAVHGTSGNIAPNPTKIAVLKIDTKAPEIKSLSPAADSEINGINTISGTVTDEGSLPVSVSLYYAPVTSVTAPTALSAYTLLNTITTATGTSDDIITYNQNISEIYSFSFTKDFYGRDTNGIDFITGTEKTKDILILVIAEDEAGNVSAISPAKYTIDRDKDRPVVALTDIDLTGVTAANPKLLKEKKIYISISDDDGVVNSAYFRTVRGSTTSDWTAISLNSGSGSFLLDDDGEQNIEFKVVDSKGKTFSPEESEHSWDKVYVTDSAAVPNTFESAIPLVLDTLSPEVTLTEIRSVSHDEPSEWVAAAAFNKTLGGITESIELKFTATDTGSGVDETKVNAIVKLGDRAIEGSPFQAAKLSGDTYTVTIPCSTGTGVLSVKLTAEDKAGREGTTERQFDQDNTEPEIHVDSPASDKEQSGSITAVGYVTESVKLSYAISPLAAYPDTYTSSTAFSYFKKDSEGNTGTVSLPAKDKSNNVITPALALTSLCAYKNYSAAETDKVSTFSLYFDGHESTGPNHTSILNDWLKNMGITTEADLISTSNSFDDCVRLYLHLKAEDSAGNVKKLAYEFWIDPQGDRPKVSFSYPTTDNPTLGGSINIIGSVEGKTSSYDVYMQIDQDGDDDWDETDRSVLAGYGYSLEEIPGLSGYYGIKIPVNGTVWSKKINEAGEFNPTEGQTRKIRIRLYAVDSEGRISSAQTRSISVDNDIPVIYQNIQLVQWNTGYSADNGFDLSNGSIQVDAEGDIIFVNGAVKAKRSYSEGMYAAGKWYVISYVTDRSGISEVRLGGSGGELLSQTISANGTKIIPYIITNENNETVTNYAFCFPIGSDTANAVGTSEINFYAKDTGEGEKAKPVNKVFKLNYDNKAPEVTELSNGLKVLNNNGYYTFGSEAYEKSEGGSNQSGIERIAFYFTRSITGQSDTVLNPLIRQEKTGNQINVSDFTAGPEGLLWKSVAVSNVSGSIISVSSVPVYAHKGGIVKINGTIYKINNIEGTDITLSDNPGATEEALFTSAGIIDSVAPEDIPTDAEKILTDYGYGYPVSTHDDGDLIPESCVKSGTKCNWEASINSKNMSDGKVTLHYIVFDKAGNYTSLTADGIVQNNSPRLAGAYIGTDDNGNGSVDEGEFISYHQLYAGGYNGLTKVTELTIPEASTAAAPVRAISIKRKTVIKPEIVGGNGTIGYTYKVSKRNAADDGWDEPYKAPVTKDNIIDLGTGTEDSDDVMTLQADSQGNTGIIITTDDILTNGITDGNYQKFAFTIWDSTPGLTYGEDTQSATLNVIMDVVLNDTTPAMNKIIPFYWKSAKENSLKDNSTVKGHIDLSKDLPAAITSKTPKVSGAIKLEGIAQDNSLLKSLFVTIKGAGYTNEYQIADYADGSWTTNSGSGWDAEIRQTTYAEFKAAGYISSNPSGKKDKDNVPYASQTYGHVVHWSMNIDTEAMGITPEEGIEISVSALDKGTPYKADGVTVNNTGAGGSAVYTSKAFGFNGSASLAVVAQTGGNDGSAAYTCKYNIDLVPYIRTIKTKLSEKSKKDDTSEYDRTALGHYPVATTETVKMTGFNLAGASSSIVRFTSNDASAAEVPYAAGGFAIPSNAKSGNVSIVVDGVESYNNRNENDAKGSAAVSKPAESTYGDEDTYDTFTDYFYNHTPNEVNNYTLTDDVVFDIWQLNSDAARPNAAGRVDEPILKINPDNGIIGFAFLSGPMRYAMPKGNTVSYNGDMQGQKDGDYHACNGFAYDSKGWAYGFEVGGTEGNPYYFHVVDSAGNENKWTIDAAKEGGQNLRYKLKSPSIAATVHESGDTVTRNVYMAYYNSYNDQIRFRSGTAASDRTMSDLLSYDDGASTTTYNSQVIACSSTANYNNGGDTSVTASPLGGASEYVCLDVTSDENGNDVVVIVWYDSSDSSLKFAYNESPTSYDWRSNTAVSDTTKRGLNRRYWSNATTIFSGAGKYCQVKVDAAGGIHIAGYDSTYGDLRYAYLPSYKYADATETSHYVEANDSYIVDSFQTTGLHIMMDVALDASNNPVPYISYMGSDMPKLAYSSTPRSNGTSSDMFTGKWEVTYIPTDNDVINLDAKELSQIDSRVNVGIWKDGDGKITDSATGTSSAAAGSGTCWGNGTPNPVVGYSIAHDTANDRIETAQMR